tara:strand:+ start:77126 stop:77392 length:267 start_codon:yes stop_codon:yes gene_type:complete
MGIVGKVTVGSVFSLQETQHRKMAKMPKKWYFIIGMVLSKIRIKIRHRVVLYHFALCKDGTISFDDYGSENAEYKKRPILTGGPFLIK